MKIPTQLAISLLEALKEGAEALDRQTDNGALDANNAYDLLSQLLDKAEEPEVKAYYKDLLDKLEGKKT